MRSYGRIGWIAVVVMFGVSALIMGRNAQLRAQSSNVTYASAEEVTKAFMKVITGEEVEGDCSSNAVEFNWRSAGLFSAREQAEFSTQEIQFMVERLSHTWRLGDANIISWEAEEVASETGSKTLRLKQGMPVTPEIVSFREGESWRINLRQTYAKWFHLKSDAELSTQLHQLKMQSCQSNLKQVSLATFQYVMDYDEKFPLAKDWQFNLHPYVKNRLVFHCPLLPEEPKDVFSPNGIGYAYNWKLDNKSLRVIDYPATMIAYYETSVREPSHSGEGADTEYRHDKGINLAFADGHVKWYSQREWTGSDSKAHFTFKQP